MNDRPNDESTNQTTTQMNASNVTLQQLQGYRNQITEQVGSVIVGQNEVVEQVLISMFSGGHVLLVGVPGLAKTLLIRTLAKTLALEFNRIQFAPDLMPSDITGTEVIQQDPETGQRTMRFIRGPVFANIILADEINRTPPKTQAAMLEAMQERQVTVGGQRHLLDDPFMVLATQNPIEQEGTYPLPEALLDRFMMQITIRYPDEVEELEIVRRTTSGQSKMLKPLFSAEGIREMIRQIREVPCADHIALYAIRLARLTRLLQVDEPESRSTDFVPAALTDEFNKLRDYINQYVRWGAGPRASQYLVMAGKTRAALNGRDCVTHDDLREVARPVLRHRIRTNFQASSDRVDADQIITRIISFLDRLDDQANRGIDSKLFGSSSSS